MEIIKNTIHKIKHKNKCIRKNVRRHVLKDKRCLAYLKDSHDQYVLVPADKANNIFVVCRKYYRQVVLDELNQDSENINAYELSESTLDNISTQHLSYMKKEHWKYLPPHAKATILLLAPKNA